MNTKILRLIDESISILERRISEKTDMEIYRTILIQIEFLQKCLANQLDIHKELGSRNFSFLIIASRNLTEPKDKDLLENLGNIAVYVGDL